MRLKTLAAITLVVVVGLVFAGVALAGTGTTTTIINDAKDGKLDGHYTSGDIQAALAYIQNNPVFGQYTDLQGLLQDYLASLQAPDPQATRTVLAFTGGTVLLALGAGLALIGSGLALRRLRV
jgi:hypothetical protein